MTLLTLERPNTDGETFKAEQPEVQPQLADAGNGALPPELPKAALTAPQPPEREQFNPDQVQLKAETKAQFDEIVKANFGTGSEAETTENEKTVS